MSSRLSSDISRKYLFSFGVIADLQYCDFPNSKSFKGMERYHRNALRQVQSLFQNTKLEHAMNYRMLFTVHLGDLIDINAKVQPKRDMHTIVSHFDDLYYGRVWNMTSNHDFYNMKRDDILDFFGVDLDRYETGHHNAFQMDDSLSIQVVSSTQDGKKFSSVQTQESFPVDGTSIMTQSTPPQKRLNHSFIYITDLNGEFINWDTYNQFTDEEYDEIWRRHFEQLITLEKYHNHLIWNDNYDEILRWKRDTALNLPKSREGWKNLCIHDYEMRRREKIYIQKLNEMMQKQLLKSHTLELKSRNDRKGYYSFNIDKFRFIVLDTYDISLLAWAEGHPHRIIAEEVIKKYHPEDVSTSINSSTHLKDDDKRFVAFNGAVGVEQMNWVVSQIKEAIHNEQRVIICSHVPLLPVDVDSTAYLWNYKECLDSFYTVGKGVIVAYLSGHAHRGGCRLDDHGTCHITVEGSIESLDDCFGEIFVYEDGLELIGSGSVKSQFVKFPAYPHKTHMCT